MSEARAHRVAKIDCEPLAPIELRRRRGGQRRLRWTSLLVWFMRIVSILWVMHSILNWSEVLGVVARDDQVPGFSSDQIFSTSVFFAVANPIAAVGLWLATPWGGVAWLVAVGAQLIAAMMIPGLFTSQVLVMVTNILLIGCYFAVTFAASREIEED